MKTATLFIVFFIAGFFLASQINWDVGIKFLADSLRAYYDLSVMLSETTGLPAWILFIGLLLVSYDIIVKFSK